MTTSWWKRNALALGVLGVLLPGTAFVIAGTEWRDYFVRPHSEAVYPDDESTVEFAETMWGPADVRTLTDSTGLNVPEGAKVLVGVLPVDDSERFERDEGNVGCDTPILVSQKDGRQWTELRAQLGLESLASEPTDCDPEVEGEPYRILAPFVVPEDVEGPFWIDVHVHGEDRKFLRFEVDF